MTKKQKRFILLNIPYVLVGVFAYFLSITPNEDTNSPGSGSETRSL